MNRFSRIAPLLTSEGHEDKKSMRHPTAGVVVRSEPEQITQAAIRLTDGSVFCGLAHAFALDQARAAHEQTTDDIFSKLFSESENGFVTSRGHFVTRKEAYEIAVKSRQ